ncbi:MAG: anti-sigma factor domain-containing protein [Planctomycetia bacterium]
MSDTTDDHAQSPAGQRVIDLLADRAVFGLEPAEERELERLLAAHPLRDPDALDRLAAAVAVAASLPGAVQLPAGLRMRLGAEALRFAGRRSDPLIEPAGRRAAAAADPRRSFPHSVPLMAAAGLLCALATLAVVVVAVRREPGRGRGQPAPLVAAPTDAAAVDEATGALAAKPTPTPATLRHAMLTAVADVLRLDCAAAVADGPQPSGDVVWSGSRQRGFLRISGLAANDPAERQYQIWIVEGGRGRPVTGGVFDVGREAEEVIVPILPQVFVQAPTTFVVTVEKPGGAAEYKEERSRILARVR